MPDVYRSGADDDYLNRFQRFVWIDKRLRQGDWPSAKELAQECGVSAKTIYRDLTTLRDEFRAPVEYDAAERGWCYTEETFSVPAAVLGERDLFALMVAENAISQYEGTPLVDYLRGAFEKILSVLPGEEREAHELAARTIHFGGLPPAMVDPDVWAGLASAIRDKRVVAFMYLLPGRDEPKHREVEPYLLIVRDRDWFLVGRSVEHDLVPIYYLPRVTQLTVLDRAFDIEEGFSVEEYLRYGFNAMQSGRKVHKVALRFASGSSHLATERPWSRDQKVTRHRDGSCTLRFSTGALFEVERQVLRYAGAVEVQKPAELRASVRRVAQAIARGHR